MSSREKILAAIKQHQPEASALPSLTGLSGNMPGTLEAYRKVLEGLGGVLFEIKAESEIPAILAQQYPGLQRVIAASDIQRTWANEDPHLLEDVDMAIVPGQWGVAENGAIWITEEDIHVRVLPFICQHLAIVLPRERLLPTMHEAYEQIGAPQSGFGVFIAGPSKTADIEQSLVLGAHGAKSLVVFVIG
ncbi:L-lactate dehydrogenase complex protein LldG [Chitinophaga polysaccharea]|uniref:L-lactate dehydrogenase complex protein LldG n=1 Tax=Chitinophaga polysaccharea TaxID=1293035 RepID=A0A561PNM2_9BACT|nr:LUD domain-containing protein [Chitinophaga polysaccharea]TWF39703.1 L-lactate dehydrogenase complex protein LldG [Chitinophaga polysaccharea]